MSTFRRKGLDLGAFGTLMGVRGDRTCWGLKPADFSGKMAKLPKALKTLRHSIDDLKAERASAMPAPQALSPPDDMEAGMARVGAKAASSSALSC